MYIEVLSKLKGEKLKKWKLLLSDTELHNNEPMPQQTVLVWDNDELVATGSRDFNILKLLAVSPKRQGEGLLPTVITELRKNAFEDGYTHLFLYTKPSNKLLFSSLFFYQIAETDSVLFMENKRSGIKDFISKLPSNTEKGIIGSLVMNCNPFTLGHQYVIEYAAKQCDTVYVFVLSEESSGFSAKDRLEMVKLGTAHLSNVIVVQTGPYLISSATFPTYFLKDRDSADRVLCDIDIEIFTKYFVPELKITRRYVGTEPHSPMTQKYNEALKNKLPKEGIELIEIPRKEFNNVAISASEVRKLIENKEKERLEDYVPQTTLNYIITNNLI